MTHISTMVNQFIQDNALNYLEYPEHAKLKCGAMTRRLKDYFDKEGIRCIALCVCGIERPENPSKVYPEDFDWSHFGHTVLLVDDIWIDLTAKQISEDYPMPYICNAREEIRKWRYAD